MARGSFICVPSGEGYNQICRLDEAPGAAFVVATGPSFGQGPGRVAKLMAPSPAPMYPCVRLILLFEFRDALADGLQFLL
jgi:hypothetical protein